MGRKASRFCSLRCSGISGTRHQSIAILGQLRCTRCNQFKPEDDFSRSARSITGRKPHCRECTAIANARARTSERIQRERANRLAYEATHRLELAEKSRRRYALVRAATVVQVTPGHLQAKWNYWGGRCWICNAAANSWDHVKPLTKGGSHMLCNLRPACRSCNSSKSNKWPFGQLTKQRSK